MLTQQQLAHSLFPLGDTTKSEIRSEAERRGLAVARKPDSHDICFISDGDTAGWLRDRLDAGPGPIVDTSGEVLGRHEGSFGFTIGQRKGLRIDRPAPDGRPRYVLDIEPVSHTVTVGPREELAVDHLTGIKPLWCDVAPDEVLSCSVQLRAHGEELPAVARLVVDGAASRWRWSFSSLPTGSRPARPSSSTKGRESSAPRRSLRQVAVPAVDERSRHAATGVGSRRWPAAGAKLR